MSTPPAPSWSRNYGMHTLLPMNTLLPLPRPITSILGSHRELPEDMAGDGPFLHDGYVLCDIFQHATIHAPARLLFLRRDQRESSWPPALIGVALVAVCSRVCAREKMFMPQ